MLEWYCQLCGPNPLDDVTDYGEGDKEPCITCGGIAHVHDTEVVCLVCGVERGQIQRDHLTRQLLAAHATIAELQWALNRKTELLTGVQEQCERVRGWWLEEKKNAEEWRARAGVCDDPQPLHVPPAGDSGRTLCGTYQEQGRRYGALDRHQRGIEAALSLGISVQCIEPRNHVINGLACIEQPRKVQVRQPPRCGYTKCEGIEHPESPTSVACRYCGKVMGLP